MKILADENVHLSIVENFRKSGFEVLVVQEIGMAGYPDYKILEYAEANDLILITGDKDFGFISYHLGCHHIRIFFRVYHPLLPQV